VEIHPTHGSWCGFAEVLTHISFALCPVPEMTGIVSFSRIRLAIKPGKRQAFARDA
jgi:hypothetical protein